jgi:hypothetical protein
MKVEKLQKLERLNWLQVCSQQSGLLMSGLQVVKERNEQCPVCNRCYVRRRGLFRPMREAHPESELICSCLAGQICFLLLRRNNVPDDKKRPDRPQVQLLSNQRRPTNDNHPTTACQRQPSNDNLPTVIAPRVAIGPNGELVINPKSLILQERKNVKIKIKSEIFTNIMLESSAFP